MSENYDLTIMDCSECGATYDVSDKRWTDIGSFIHNCDPEIRRDWQRMQKQKAYEADVAKRKRARERELALETYDAEVRCLEKVADNARKRRSEGMTAAYDAYHARLRELRTDADCPACAGTGQLLSHECSRCDGAGEVVHGD